MNKIKCYCTQTSPKAPLRWVAEYHTPENHGYHHLTIKALGASAAEATALLQAKISR
jgi:hypothetical protein